MRAYWWWLNGNVTEAAITRDLEEMAAKGFGGALICDAGGAEQDGNDQVPHGPTFFSPEWRELYKHALREADRLGLEMSLNIQSGWNLGGPTVRAEDAPKKLVWSELRVTGPARFERQLPEPQHRPELYRDVAVVAYPLKSDEGPKKTRVAVSSSSARPDQPATNACDGTTDTFWVSAEWQRAKVPHATGRSGCNSALMNRSPSPVFPCKAGRATVLPRANCWPPTMALPGAVSGPLPSRALNSPRRTSPQSARRTSGWCSSTPRTRVFRSRRVTCRWPKCNWSAPTESS